MKPYTKTLIPGIVTATERSLINIFLRYKIWISNDIKTTTTPP
jgi:hypothetical protein